MFDIITIGADGQEYHSNDFRHRQTGYATYAEAERFADVLVKQSTALAVYVVPRNEQ